MSKLFGGGDEKEARRQEDIASQTAQSQSILNQFLAQLLPGSEEFNRLQTEGLALVRSTGDAGDQAEIIRQLGSQLVTQQNARIAAGEPATALEARTNLAFGGLREAAGFTPEEQDIFDALRGTSEGELTPSGDIFGQLVNRALKPEDFFQSTFNPQLQLIQDAVKSRAASRGILGSGLELEHLGRAGTELAIREAQARETFRQQQLGNFWDVFNVGQGLRGREIGLEEALLNLQQGRESRLGDYLGRESSLRTSDLRDLLGTDLSRKQELLDLANAQSAQRSGQVGQAIGTGIGALGGFFIGGPAGSAVGARIGGQLGSGGSDAGSLLGASRQPGVTGLQTSGGVTSLTRQPQLNPENIDINALLQFLQAGGKF